MWAVTIPPADSNTDGIFKPAARMRCRPASVSRPNRSGEPAFP
jgi:hypothetical protein